MIAQNMARGRIIAGDFRYSPYLEKRKYWGSGKILVAGKSDTKCTWNLSEDGDRMSSFMNVPKR
jgi:hypothetical protein